MNLTEDYRSLQTPQLIALVEDLEDSIEGGDVPVAGGMQLQDLYSKCCKELSERGMAVFCLTASLGKSGAVSC